MLLTRQYVGDVLRSKLKGRFVLLGDRFFDALGSSVSIAHLHAEARLAISGRWPTRMSRRTGRALRQECDDSISDVMGRSASCEARVSAIASV